MKFLPVLVALCIGLTFTPVSASTCSVASDCPVLMSADRTCALKVECINNRCATVLDSFGVAALRAASQPSTNSATINSVDVSDLDEVYDEIAEVDSAMARRKRTLPVHCPRRRVHHSCQNDDDCDALLEGAFCYKARLPTGRLADMGYCYAEVIAHDHTRLIWSDV